MPRDRDDSPPMDCTGTLSRGLWLLRLINQMHPVRVHELASETNLHKATVSRIVNTLASSGYLIRDETGAYSPSSQVRKLSDGVDANEWVKEAVVPELDRLAQAIQWPSDFAIFEGRGMAIVCTTRATAPINHIRPPVNVRNISMFDSDFGQAMLAFANDKQRHRLLEVLSRRYRANPEALRVNALLEGLKLIRQQGYATRSKNFQFAGATTIAVPVVVSDACIAAFNVVVSAPMPEESIVANYLLPMQDASRAIGSKLRLGGHGEIVSCV